MNGFPFSRSHLRVLSLIAVYMVSLSLSQRSSIAQQPQDRASNQRLFLHLADQFISSREAIVSYQTKIKARYHGAKTKGGAKFDHAYELEMMVDRTTNSFLCFRNSVPSIITATDKGESQVVLIAGGQYYLGAGGNLVLRGGYKSAPIIDPLVHGSVFCGEVMQFSPVEEALTNFRGLNSDRWAIKRVGPRQMFSQVPFDEEVSFTKPRFLVSFDVDKGVPVEIVFSNVSLRVKVDYAKYGQHWLASQASYVCGNNDFALTFDIEWFNVNEPIPELLFKPANVSKLCGLKFEDQATADDLIKQLLVRPE